MRLTLRTLLAYLDGILDSNDAQDIGKKIEESEYATGLVHRIRDVMRRLRLGAPSLTDRSPQLDPNTVAEYLDNTLASDAVTDFEKVCLESDVHLAEVASCHQILTLVLGEAAEIDPSSRQRMYQLKDAPVSTGPPPTPTAGATPADYHTDTPPDLNLDQGDDESGERKARPRPTVPEYLREPRKRGRWLPVAAAVLVACFTLFVLMALGQFEPTAPLGKILVRWGLRQAPEPSPPPELAAAPQGTFQERGEARWEKGPTLTDKNLSPNVAQPPSAVENLPGQPGAAVPQMGSKSAKESAGELGPKPVEPLPQPVTKPPITVPPVKEPPVKEPLPSIVKEVPAIEPMKEPAGELPKEPPKTPPKPPTASLVIKGSSPDIAQPPSVVPSHPGQPGPALPQAGLGIGIKPPAEPGAAAEDKASETKLPAVPPVPEPLGRLMSSDQVLLTDDPKGGWQRVAPNQMLVPQRVLVLPTYRAKVTLTFGVTLEILGGTQLELLAGGPQEFPGIRVLYGRVVMMPLAQPGSRLRVVFGERGGVVTFADAESVAALDVRRVRVPGTNPETGPPHVVADLYASAGTIVWDEPGVAEGPKTLQLVAPQWVSFNAALTSEPAISKELPKWITAEPIGALDRRASLSLANQQALPTDRLARLALLEVVTSRPQKEVRWLALRCLGYIGQYDDMVKALGDPARRLDWPEYVDQLRDAVARDAESAAAVRLALEKQYPQQAANLYRMLWGYSDKDLQSGADKSLVKALDDDTLAVRVLSFWNLRELTGLGLFYRPEQTAAKRQQPIRRWGDRLAAGEIRLKTPEEKAGAAAAEKVVPPPAPDAGKRP